MIEIKDSKTIWNNCISQIREMVGEQSFKTWFEPIVPVSLKDNVLTIQVPSMFFYEWLEEHYVHVLKHVIHSELGPNGRLEYSISNPLKPSDNNARTPNLYPSSKSHMPQQHKNNTGETYHTYAGNNSKDLLDLESALNPNYTFESFVEGDCNRLARSAGWAVANKPGSTAFNPLMIYGKVGLGKTHLVQAIGNHIKKHSPSKVVLYISSERFANQFMEAIKNNMIREFSSYFMKTDILIFDDVQFFSGKEKTQEIFFHIFNDLHQAGKQIIMTSDKAPKDLTGFQERLLSRFKWGLTADLQVPDFETRMAIINNKAMAEGIEIPKDVLEYLAYSIDTNVRELEGVIISMVAHASLNQKPIDLELAKQAIQSIVQNIEAEVGIDYIQKFVAEHFNVTIEQMKDKTRKREIVVARQVAMYFAKEYTNMSLKSIGSHFGNRDHSTVIHALQSINDLMDTDRKFNATMQELIKKIKLKSL
ncbi:MAG: chromosomal replication initiator protein DnaA [Cytophagaceae bacterium]|nr:chromosomal replication initiator protein DnaA [Cytophagaceae bacterium]MDW8456119.1 chromosomal replication initiator protein DnaA [Cytophagaceae bacterium]